MRWWSEHLAASGDFEHQNLNVIVRRCDGARSAGENIARGGVSPRTMVRLWMNSPGHRANILQPGFRRLGVGVAAGAPQPVNGAAATYVTNFGR